MEYRLRMGNGAVYSPCWRASPFHLLSEVKIDCFELHDRYYPHQATESEGVSLSLNPPNHRQGFVI
ncbi:MAG: hypothetical protein RMJ66_08575 [Bacteroidia bacterium]|nr:hypothetical protein [Bacteroidia bacterium]